MVCRDAEFSNYKTDCFLLFHCNTFQDDSGVRYTNCGAMNFSEII